MEKEEWLKRYKARLIEHGVDENLAEENTQAVEDSTYCDDPESAADDELSYWASDG
jgi:hypothetical protein